jgi:hypothetical protein
VSVPLPLQRTNVAHHRPVAGTMTLAGAGH